MEPDNLLNSQEVRIKKNGNVRVKEDTQSYLKHLLQCISPTRDALASFQDSVDWISNRLLSYRLYEDEDGNIEDKQVFSTIKRGGSTVRGTALLPIRDIDLIAFMTQPENLNSLNVTFKRVISALTLGASSVIQIHDESPSETKSLLYKVQLDNAGNDDHHGKFVIRWQRHSFGICFGEEWDNSKTNFDIVPVFCHEGKWYLTSRFIQNKEIDLSSVAMLESKVTGDVQLQETVRLFKAWNKRHRNTEDSSCPFRSIELEAAIAFLWEPEKLPTCPAERIIFIFASLQRNIGKLCYLPGVEGGAGTKILLGSEHLSWSFSKVRDLCRVTKNLLRSAHYFVQDSELAINVWKSLFTDFDYRATVAIPFITDLFEEDDPKNTLHSVIMNDQPLEKIEKLFYRRYSSDNAVNSKDSGGCTAVFLAASRGKADVVAFLLQVGADPLITGEGDFRLYDTLHCAVAFGHSEECVDLLLNHRESMGGLSTEALRDRLAMALIHAVKIPHEAIINRLLSENADVSHRPYGVDFDAWLELWSATGSIPLSIVRTFLLRNPEVNNSVLMAIAVRGDKEIIEELFGYVESRDILTFEFWFLVTKVSVQFGYHTIVEWLLKLVTSKDYFQEAVGKLPGLIMNASSVGFHEVVKILLTYCTHIHSSVVIYCAGYAHADTLRAIFDAKLELLEPPDIQICFHVHCMISTYKSAADLFAFFMMQYCDIDKLVEFFDIRSGFVSYLGTKYGTFPAALYPLFFDERLRDRADKFLTAADRRRFHLLMLCKSGHEKTREVAICTSCQNVHLMCADCVRFNMFPQSIPAHEWDIRTCATNAVMIDHICGTNLVITLARLGCRTAIEKSLELERLDEGMRQVATVYLEMLQSIEAGATLPQSSSPAARSLMDSCVQTALDEQICTRKVTQELPSRYAMQFHYECFTCGLIRANGCCEVCVFSCHSGHDIALMPKLSKFECDCGTAGASCHFQQALHRELSDVN